jgi:hypothetical protein
MSILARLLAWLGALSPARPSLDPDRLSVTDWADLPAHHPDCKTC